MVLHSYRTESSSFVFFFWRLQMSLQNLENRHALLVKLQTLKRVCIELTLEPDFENTSEEFQDNLENLEFELDLELKERE